MSLSPLLKREFEDLSHQDNDFDLMRCCLLTSRIIQPSGNVEQALKVMDEISQDLDHAYHAALVDFDGVDAKRAALQQVLGTDQGFHGDENALNDLNHLNFFYILKDGCASPLTLNILYLHCARQCGWDIDSLNFPGYHLLSLCEGNQRLILDPFQHCLALNAPDLRQLLKIIGGAQAELTPDHYRPLPAKALALRHLGTLKVQFLRYERMESALEVLEASTLLDPENHIFWQEIGMLYIRLGRLNDAKVALDKALSYSQDGHTKHKILQILSDLTKKS